MSNSRRENIVFFIFMRALSINYVPLSSTISIFNPTLCSTGEGGHWAGKIDFEFVFGPELIVSFYNCSPG